MLLTKEQVQAAKDRKIVKVKTPEWAPDGTPPEQAKECHVFVRSMTGAERDSFEWWAVDNRKSQGNLYRASFVARTACDEQGNLLFSVEDVSWLSKKNAKALDRVHAAARALSGMTLDDEKELEKNSEPGEGGFSSS
jgi:hypothetical protein